jgi:hypothetical protein
MKAATLILQNAIRLLGVVLIVLGVLFWTGNALRLIPLHMRLGETLIVLLWILSSMALRRGAPLGLVLGAIAYGIIVVGFGMTMGRMLPGPAHEIIRVLHLLIGLGAIGLAEMLGGRIRRAAA